MAVSEGSRGCGCVAVCGGGFFFQGEREVGRQLRARRRGRARERDHPFGCVSRAVAASLAVSFSASDAHEVREHAPSRGNGRFGARPPSRCDAREWSLEAQLQATAARDRKAPRARKRQHKTPYLSTPNASLGALWWLQRRADPTEACARARAPEVRRESEKLRGALSVPSGRGRAQRLGVFPAGAKPRRKRGMSVCVDVWTE
jgi:hypothetical protein